ncbi:hypothetical protein [Enhygromyxa salina]|uniref:Uncharacterized protein n=1 Tax=Enhygromyxa salina TaxID=215803 RepID=A0A2S9XQ80_9BACT|nr:hypothetical protein [Enhygromyxa salina]PRP94900.1 hypothetical protein ENSA7_77230 [Enhygromyxa salina]
MPIFDAGGAEPSPAVPDPVKNASTACRCSEDRFIDATTLGAGGSRHLRRRQLWLWRRTLLDSNAADARVERANATFRWTGSWLTIFVSVDPIGAFTMTRAQLKELEDLVDCVRQVGRDVHVLAQI